MSQSKLHIAGNGDITITCGGALSVTPDPKDLVISHESKTAVAAFVEEAAKGDNTSLKVMVDPGAHNMITRLYKTYIHEEKLGKLPAFAYALDQLLAEFGGKPPEDEDDSDEDEDDDEDSDDDESDEPDPRERADDGEEEEEPDPEYEEDASLVQNPQVTALANSLRKNMIIAGHVTEQLGSSVKPKKV